MALEGLLAAPPDADVKAIAATPLKEVEEELRRMGLEYDRSLPEWLGRLASGAEGRDARVQSRAVCVGRFEDADALYRRGVEAYIHGYIDQAIEHWRAAKMIFLCIDKKREIAACDRNIGVGFQRLGRSRQAIVQFERAKGVYLYIGLEEQVASCNRYIGAAYREISGHSWR